MKIKTVVIQTLIMMTVLAIISCKSDSDNMLSPSDISDQNLQGEVEGVSWVFVSGKASISLWDATEISIELYSNPVDSVCDPWVQVDGDLVFFSIPNQAGDYQLSFTDENSHTVTLFDQETSMNNIAISGIISIYEITATEVSLGINATADNVNFVNGKCTVPFCE